MSAETPVCSATRPVLSGSGSQVPGKRPPEDPLVDPLWVDEPPAPEELFAPGSLQPSPMIPRATKAPKRALMSPEYLGGPSAPARASLAWPPQRMLPSPVRSGAPFQTFGGSVMMGFWRLTALVAAPIGFVFAACG